MVHIFGREPQQINLMEHMLYNSFPVFIIIFPLFLLLIMVYFHTFHQESFKVIIK